MNDNLQQVTSCRGLTSPAGARWQYRLAIVVVVAISGMAGSTRLLAQPATETEQDPGVEAVLSGRIVDPSGAPVTDATLNLMGKTRKPDGSMDYQTAKTDAEGRYAFETVAQMDTYRMQIESTRWVGLTNWRELPEMQLSPLSRMKRDFELEPACVARIQVVDEQGNPVPRVRILVAPLSNEQFVNANSASTDDDGWATVGGLVPSEQQYLCGTMHDEYAFAKLIMKLDDPAKKYEEKIVLSPGVEVSGVALCSDGKPAVGWTVNAMPKWWNFTSSPHGQAIDNVGGFTLPHVAPGEYDVHVSIPTGEGMYRQHTALIDAKLPPPNGQLKLNLSVPSPKSMVAIMGVVKVEGQPRKENISIHASSENGKHSGHGSVGVGEREFRISPLPPGRYTLTFNSTEVEQVRLDGIEAPTDEVEVTLKSIGRPRLSGSVVRGDTKEPLQHFRVRVMKVRYLRGPGYVQDSSWQTVDDPLGLFSMEVVGPGIYQIMVDADGLAPARSEPINTDDYEGKPVWLELNEGVTLRGTVVDQQGNPVDGAVITTSTYSNVPTGINQGATSTADSSVRTIAGKFEIPHLPAGEETLTVKHPDFCSMATEPITIGDSDLEVDPIVLNAGGTVEGRVYDGRGKPEANVTLYVQLGSSNNESARLATVVTDQDGYYRAEHLPEMLCEVQRAKVWDSLGVVRTRVLPTNGQISRIDLGGPEAATGRLLINGQPLQNERVQLGGDHPNFSTCVAYAQTDDDGNFTFWGPAPGKRVLYYRAPGTRGDWIRAGEVMVVPGEPASSILGDIDIRSATLTVPVAGVPEDQLAKIRMMLIEYRPRWPFGNDVGVLQSRQELTDPFVFNRVLPGQYELVCRRLGDNLSLRKLVEVTADQHEQSAAIEWPAATGSLEVRLDDQARSQEEIRSPYLWSTDGRFYTSVDLREEGKTRYEKLPAGDYYLATAGTRNPPRIAEFSVAPDEETVLELTEEHFQSPPRDLGMIVVQCFTPDGLVLDGCTIDLKSDSGSVQESNSQGGRTNVIGDPGEYTMTVSYPGFETARQQVTIKPVLPNGRVAGDVSVHVHMVPADNG